MSSAGKEEIILECVMSRDEIQEQIRDISESIVDSLSAIEEILSYDEDASTPFLEKLRDDFRNIEKLLKISSFSSEDLVCLANHLDTYSFKAFKTYKESLDRKEDLQLQCAIRESLGEDARFETLLLKYNEGQPKCIENASTGCRCSGEGSVPYTGTPQQRNILSSPEAWGLHIDENDAYLVSAGNLFSFKINDPAIIEVRDSVQNDSIPLERITFSKWLASVNKDYVIVSREKSDNLVFCITSLDTTGYMTCAVIRFDGTSGKSVYLGLEDVSNISNVSFGSFPDLLFVTRFVQQGIETFLVYEGGVVKAEIMRQSKVGAWYRINYTVDGCLFSLFSDGTRLEAGKSVPIDIVESLKSQCRDIPEQLRYMLAERYNV